MLTNGAMTQKRHELGFCITQVFIEVKMSGEVVHVDPVFRSQERFYEKYGSQSQSQAIHRRGPHSKRTKMAFGLGRRHSDDIEIDIHCPEDLFVPVVDHIV